MKKRRYVVLVLLMTFLFTAFPNAPPAYAWSDSGLGCPVGQRVNINNFHPLFGYYLGLWNVRISGAVSGSGQAVYINTEPSGGGDGYCFINNNNYHSAAQEMNGHPAYVTRNLRQAEIYWGSTRSYRSHIRDFAPLCGATVTRYDQGNVYIQTTAYPNARISPPSTIKAGEQARIAISGTSFTPSESPSGISYKFYVDSSQVDSGSGTKSFSKQVSYTFPTAKSYTLKLEVTDGVERTTTETIRVDVKSGAMPPTPPPGGNMPPVADFDLPYSAEVNESVRVEDRSVDYDGSIINWKWEVVPSSYTGTLSNSGGTLRFSQEGRYTVRLTVTDNKGATGWCVNSINIGETLPPPPPPEPPEPENIPPVARFSVPMECSPGKTVNVENRSYDPDGYIEEVEWRVSPSSGITEKNLDDNGGTLVFDELGIYTIKLIVTDDRGDSDSVEKEIEVVNKPPVARIKAPDSLMQGEDITIRSASRDPDGEIIKLTWTVTPAEYMVGELSGEESTVYFDKEGECKITLTVEDDWGATDTDEVILNIEPAIPQAFFKDKGVYKQNRQIILTEEGQSPSRYPIIKEQNKWESVPAGDGAVADAIRVKDVSYDKKEVLFKTPGTYKSRLKVTNTAGHTSEWYEREFKIQPDEPPVADFVLQQAYLRDLNNGKKATIELRDTSYSPDGDIIVHRTWKYRYDSNNDGGFKDEQWVVFSDSNDPAPSFQTDQVGKYQVELEVTEGFGEDTIAEFVSPEDYLKADTTKKALDEKIGEVINIRPSVGFDVLRKKKADIVFIKGNVDPSKTQNLQGLVNQYLITELNSHNVDATIQVKEGEALDDILRQIVWRENASHFLINISDGASDGEINDYHNGLSMESSFYGDYGGTGGNHADGGYEAAGGYYWFAKNRYVDMGEVVHKDMVDSITFSAVTGGQDPTLRDIFYYVSSDANTWHSVGSAKATHIQRGILTVMGKNLPISNIRYLRANNDRCVDDAKFQLIGRAINNESPAVLANLLNYEINFSVMGTAENKQCILDFIAKNDNRGTWISNNNMNTAMQQLTSYIISKLEAAYGPVENYVLLNEEVYYKTYYNDPENDPKMAERWKYTHDPTYFENSLGRVSFNEQWRDGPVYRFDKVGEFKTTFQARDNPKNDIRFAEDYWLWSYMPIGDLHLYVHRRPVAMFGVRLTKSGNNYNVAINSNAYDLDHASRPDKGIVEHKWSWRPATNATWNNGKPTVFAKDSNFLIKYEVKDIEGAWSHPVVKLLSTSNANMAPVAQFTVTPNPVVVNKPLTINDLSYDPNGDTITQRQWRIKPPGGAWGSATSSPPTKCTAIGEWEIELKVSDGSLWSEPFYQTVQAIPDNTAPVARFTVQPNPVYDIDPVSYNDTSYDPDGDPIIAREWRISKDGGAWTYYTNPPTVFETIGGAGVYNIELRVQDQPRLPQLEPMWSKWHRQTLTVTESYKVNIDSITPNPGERGRNITVKASALRASKNQPVEIDRMKVIIPFGATSSHEAWMEYDSVNKVWHYTYTIPELSTKGLWPDDGTYSVKVIGYRGSIIKEDVKPFRIEGHIKKRVIIRTTSW